MGTLDWSFVVLLSSAFLFTLFSLVLLLNVFKSKKRLKAIKRKRPPKNKKRRKRFFVAKRKLQVTLKKQIMWTIILIFMAGGTSAGAVYSRYYQQNKLNGKESESIVQSYYILTELTTQLENVNKNENPQKSIKNVRGLSNKLVSYGFITASVSLKEEKQHLLNRYFIGVKELGKNLSEQSVETLQEKEAYQGYMNDIEKIKANQTEVFKEFKINEAALKKKQ
ncbi:hypothetical protein JZO66_06115 [Enterococcus sp. DIV0242_7C1]|uniref:Uncharacterized protein n=1 Tax=Candidatus Enterococcus dunnyi TaxID=1834192 RepID=A0A200IZZ4_9ENTE|nr:MULTISPECIES: hypothetical protein [unclassified Enterococcus]MBO0470111.1 hypothetical protein [Enterococcus sp. DIV0242_7C1]OUZ30564.1 hypothetical protein A5889_002852 [Enterococcus sp. 9D6_DIV0238]